MNNAFAVRAFERIKNLKEDRHGDFRRKFITFAGSEQLAEAAAFNIFEGNVRPRLKLAVHCAETENLNNISMFGFSRRNSFPTKALHGHPVIGKLRAQHLQSN